MRNGKWPSRSSTLSPKIQRYHMFPIRCSQPPCRNIDVRNGKTTARNGTSDRGQANTAAGTTPYCSINGSSAGPRETSYKKTTTFTRIRKIVITGNDRDGMLSLKGIMFFKSALHGRARAIHGGALSWWSALHGRAQAIHGGA